MEVNCHPCHPEMVPVTARVTVMVTVWLCICLQGRHLHLALKLLEKWDPVTEVGLAVTVAEVALVVVVVVDGVGLIWERISQRLRRFAKDLISLLLVKKKPKRCFLWLFIIIIRGFTMPI